jgi:cellulose synthase/poly-beta-1,6-N-acetylglucosamine synthase-like glycosyltransferase
LSGRGSPRPIKATYGWGKDRPYGSRLVIVYDLLKLSLFVFSETIISGIALFLLAFTLPAIALFFSRLLKGPQRRAPVAPQRPHPEQLGKVSIIVPTLNEVERLSPCLAGLSAQSYEVREILIVDSRSQDGTRDLVKDAAQQDPRLRLLTDDPLPPDWVGRPWALHNGFLSSSAKSEWVLGVDADTQPQPGLVAGLLAVAESEGYDLVSCSPQLFCSIRGMVVAARITDDVVVSLRSGGRAQPGTRSRHGQRSVFLLPTRCFRAFRGLYLRETILLR